MKKTNSFLAILVALLFVSCGNDEKNDEQQQVNVNAQKLIGTWRYSYVVDLDSIANEMSLDLPLLLGKATFNYEWTFNEDKTTGFVNAFLDYKGNKINAAEYPKNFEYTATETKITFPIFPYKEAEIGFNFLLWAAGLWIFIPDPTQVDEDISTPYYIIEEENKLFLHLPMLGSSVEEVGGEKHYILYVKQPK